MKKVAAGFISCLGLVSSVLTIANVFPQYNNIFLVLIGIFVGFLLGTYTPNDGQHEHMSQQTVGYLLMAIMFLLPPLLLVGLIAAIVALGFMTEALIGPILGWGLFAILIAYIVAGCVASDIGTPKSPKTTQSQQGQQNSQTK